VDDELQEELIALGEFAGNILSKISKTVIKQSVKIASGLKTIAVKGIKLASDLEQINNVVDVTFGANARQMDTFAKAALNGYGVAELAAKQYAGTFGSMLKAYGVTDDNMTLMSKNLVALSGDFASLYNMDPAATFEKLKGAMSGDAGSLMEFGINMSDANLNAYALSKGVQTSYGSLDEASQAMIRYNYIIEKSTAAQNDFSSSQDSFATQQYLLEENINQLAGTIMSAALPALANIFGQLNDLVTEFANSPDKVAKLQEVIRMVGEKAIEIFPTVITYVKRIGVFMGQLAEKALAVFHFIYDNWSLIAPLLATIVAGLLLLKTIAVGLQVYRGIMTMITAAQWLLNSAVLANPMTWVIVGIVAAVAILLVVINKIRKNWDGISSFIVGIWQNYVLPFFLGIPTFFSNLWNGIVSGITTYWNLAASWIVGIWQSYVLPFFLGIPTFFSNLWSGIVNGIATYWNLATSWILGLWQNTILPFFLTIPTFFSNLWTGVVGSLITAWQGVGTFFSGLWSGITSVFTGAANMMITPINQIISALNQVRINLPDWVEELTGYSSFGINIPLIPMFAKGGFANQPSIFGEAGPEVAIPLKRTPRSLGLLSQTASMLGADISGGSSGPTFIFSPVISGGNAGALASAVRAAGDDFFEQCDAWWESKRRVSFG
jgi:hypothetical protein